MGDQSNYLGPTEWAQAKGDMVRHRGTLGRFFKMCGYQLGCEVGVQKGAFSRELMSEWGGVLFMVDAWKHWPADVYVDRSNVSDERHFELMEEAMRVSDEFGGRGLVMRATSAKAAELMQVPLDFVYIDAQHSYDAVVEDIGLWWPHVAPGGCLCGHDYPGGNKASRRFDGLKRAVRGFSEREGLKVFLTNERGSASWMVRKHDPWRDGLVKAVEGRTK